MHTVGKVTEVQKRPPDHDAIKRAYLAYFAFLSIK